MRKKKDKEVVEEKKSKIPAEIKGIIFILISVLGLFKTGPFGRLISNSAVFIFGKFYMILLLIFCVYGIYILAFRKKLKISKKIVSVATILLLFLAYFSITEVMASQNIGTDVFTRTLDNIFNSIEGYEVLYGSGILGAFIAFLLVLLVDIKGAKIVIFTITLILLMLLFNFSISKVLYKFIGIFRKKKKMPKEETEETDNKTIISNIDELNTIEQRQRKADEQLMPHIEKIYNLPSFSLLDNPKKVNTKVNEESINTNISLLEQVLNDFDIHAKVVKVHTGPTITQFELEIKAGTKVNKITGIDREIALALSAKSVKIQAPIPGKNTIGIEIPNKVTTMVTLKEVLAAVPANKDSSKLLVALGKTIMGEATWMELNKAPHLLIGGVTGSGKSVCINSLIVSILMRAKPDEVKFVMIDPKKVELSIYNGIPHLLSPVVTDPRKASVVLKKLVEEMEQRYEIFSQSGAKNMASHNTYLENKNLKLPPDERHALMPYIVIVIDELADLMIVAAKEVEDSIIRIASMARAAGIHLIAATQRPSTEVITGIVKTNLPSKISFAVSSLVDSRIILDMSGAEKLLGKGDMLFLPMGEGVPVRVQGTFVSEQEVKKVVNHVIKEQKAEYDEKLLKITESSISASSYSGGADDYEDPLYDEIVEFVVMSKKISASLLQRKYRIGYNRAARVINLLEERRIVGPPNGARPREVLVALEESEE